MSDIQKAYCVKEIKSTCTALMFENLNAFFSSIEGEYDIICWQDQGVYRGTIKDKTIAWLRIGKYDDSPSLDGKYWQRARIFNENEEYYLHFRGGEIVGRHREDDTGNKIEVIKSCAVLRSIVADKPVATEKKNSLERIKVINYLGYDEVGKVQVIDMRFVNFKYGI